MLLHTLVGLLLGAASAYPAASPDTAADLSKMAPLLWNRATYVGPDGKVATTQGRTSLLPFWWWGAHHVGAHMGELRGWFRFPHSYGPLPSLEAMGVHALMHNAAQRMEDKAIAVKEGRAVNGADADASPKGNIESDGERRHRERSRRLSARAAAKPAR